MSDFTGRAEHLAALDALLPDTAGGTRTAVISAVDGAAGIGKTTLAVWWAHQVQDQFPDGTLYTNLRGYGPSDPATPGEALDGFLRGLGVSANAIPRGEEAQAGLFRSVLAGRRVLIVLDNARGADQVRPLLPGAHGCLVLITSRDSLTGLVVAEGAHRLTLDLLTEHEAKDLVGGIIGPTRLAAEPEAVATLIRLCARLPLALRIAASRVAAWSHATVADVVTELADEPYRLDALSWGEDDRAAVRAVFDWSYQRLATEQRRMFRFLALHPGPEIGAHAAAALADLSLGTARRLLTTLADAHLIEPFKRDRYRFHDLLRAYAADQAQHDSGACPGEHDQALDRVLRWYAWHAATAHHAVFPWETFRGHVLSTATRSHPEVIFAKPTNALTWFDDEAANLAAAVRAAANSNRHQLVVLLALTVSQAIYRTGDFAALLEIQQLGVASAHKSDDRATEIVALLDFGQTHLNAGELRETTDILLNAQSMARELDDAWLQAWALNELGLLCIRQQQYTRALGYLRSALPLSIGAQNGRFEGVIEDNLSIVYSERGDYQQALQHAERGLVLRQRAGDSPGEGYALQLVARARQGMGEHLKAIALCEQALNIEDFKLYPDGISGTLDVLGTSLRHIGNTERARICWREALTIYEKLKDRRAADLQLRLRALDAVPHDHTTNGVECWPK